MISLNEFLELPTEEVATLVRAAGPQVCAFLSNGTRRWFLLEHSAEAAAGDPVGAYLDITGQRHIEIYKLLFDHGVDTVLSPVFGGELLKRGGDYVQRIGMDGLAHLASHPDFKAFYEQSDVRVRFYGDHRKQLRETPYADLSDTFDAAAEATRSHKRARLFYGVFASDPTETIAELSIRYYRENGRPPDRATLVEMYYGDRVAPVNFFIGADKFNVFAMPLVALGEEDLYFTVGPSLYLTEPQLRAILYDHLYTRRVPKPDYAAMPGETRRFMQDFYQINRGRTLGLGDLHEGVWYPTPEVQWPK